MSHKFSVFSIALLTTACASRPTAQTPLYTEATAALPASAAKGVCKDPATDVTDYRARLPEANRCVGSGDWAKVEAHGQALATGAPDVPWGLYYLALAAGEAKTYARAQWLLDRAVKMAPDQALFHFEIARLAWAMGDDAKVHREMALAAKLDPELSEAHLFLGRSSLRQNDFANARRELQTVLAHEPQHAAALLALAETELKSESFAEAEQILVRAVKQNPRLIAPRLELARVREDHLQKYGEALAGLTEMRRLAAERKLDQPTPADLSRRIEALEKAVAKADQDKSRMPSAERK